MSYVYTNRVELNIHLMDRMTCNFHVIARVSKRKLAGCYRSSSGYLHTPAGKVAYESGLERDYFTQLSFHPGFRRITWNPIELEYTDSLGDRRIYTPDALVEFGLGSGMPPYLLLELKTREDLVVKIDQLRDGFYAAREYASSMQGWRFEVRTERSLIPALVSNANFLSRYHTVSLEDQFPDYPKRLYEELKARGRATPEVLICACCSTFEEKAKALPYVWAMLAKRIVAFDMHSPIDNRSPIWIPS